MGLKSRRRGRESSGPDPVDLGTRQHGDVSELRMENTRKRSPSC